MKTSKRKNRKKSKKDTVHTQEKSVKTINKELDEELEDTFPASDPITKY